MELVRHLSQCVRGLRRHARANDRIRRPPQLAFESVLGFCVAACALAAIVYGLTDAQRWNQKFNPLVDEEDESGQTHWLTVIGLASSLFIGTTALMATLAFSFQRYFEMST